MRQRRGIAERRHRQPGLAVDLDERDVGVGIGADHAGAQTAAVRQLDRDALGAIDDVVVRQDAAVGVDDEAAAGAAAHRIAVVPRRPEVERLVEQVRAARAAGVRGAAGGVAPRVVASMFTTARVDALDDVREIDDRAARAVAGFRRIRDFALGRRRRPGHDRRPRHAAGEDGPDEERHDGGEGEGDEGEAANPARQFGSKCGRPTFFHYKSQKRLLIQRFDAELAGLLELAAGVGAGNQIRRFLADRPGDLRAQPLERFGGLLARHRRQRAGQHEHLAGQRPGLLVGRLGQPGSSC